MCTNSVLTVSNIRSCARRQRSYILAYLCIDRHLLSNDNHQKQKQTQESFPTTVKVKNINAPKNSSTEDTHTLGTVPIYGNGHRDNNNADFHKHQLEVRPGVSSEGIVRDVNRDGIDLVKIDNLTKNKGTSNMIEQNMRSNSKCKEQLFFEKSCSLEGSTRHIAVSWIKKQK